MPANRRSSSSVSHPLLPGSAFVNADVIAKDRWPDAAEEHSYEAARIAATMRDALIERGESFHRRDGIFRIRRNWI